MPQIANDCTHNSSHDFRPTSHHPVIAELLEPTSTTCAFVSVALDCAARGLSVHPLGTRDKSPLLQDWPRKATRDEEVIRAWATEYPEANVGIVTGPQSGIIVLDVDYRHGGRRSLEALEDLYGPLPISWEVLTHDGRHLYFRHPGGTVKTTNFVPGIQIRGDGANVVAPQSIHPSGSLYVWNPYIHPDVTPLADMPSWLGSLLQGQAIWHPATAHPPTPQQVHLLASGGAVGVEREIGGPLTGERVAALFSEEWIVKKCLRVLGLGGIEIGKKFACVLHEEEHPSASIMPPRESGDSFVYVDFHEREAGRKGFPLPLVYYRLATGETTGTLPKPSFLVWSVRLLRDAGVLRPMPVHAPQLAPDAPDAAKKVYAAFGDLLSLKWLIDTNDPSPFTWRFAMKWAGLTMRTVQKGIAWLLGRGYLRCAGHWGELGKKIMLFVLGTRAFIRRRSGRDETEGGQEQIVEAVKPDEEAMYTENKTAVVRAMEKQSACHHERDKFHFGEVTVCAECFSMLGCGGVT